MALDGMSNGPNTGIQGQPGPRGNTILTVQRAPQPTDGWVGDYAFDEVSKKFYGPKREDIGWDLSSFINIAAGGADPTALPLNVKSFGAVGDGITDDTFALQLAHTAWRIALSLGRNIRLVYPGGTYKISQSLPLPDANGWQLEAQGQVKFIQTTNNTFIFELLVTAYRSRFGILGNFTFSWANAQPAANTRAIAIALGCSVEVVDGIFDFLIQGIVVQNGFRGISVHPDTEANNFKFPIWGFRISDVTGFNAMTGATIALYSPNPNVGSPRATIENFYVQGNGSTEARLIIKGVDQLVITNAEFNQGDGRQMLIQGCRQVMIDGLRLEQARSTTAGLRCFEFSGTSTQALINNVEVQSHTVNLPNANDECFLINSDGGYVGVMNFSVIDITTTQGNFYAIGTSSGGAANYGGDLRRSNEGRSYLHNVTAAPSILPFSMKEIHLNQANVGAGANFTAISTGLGVNDYAMSSPCYLVGIYVRVSSALTAGSLSVYANKDGASIGTGQYAATINVGSNNGSRYHPCWKAFIANASGNTDIDHRFGRGNLLSFSLVTSADFAPINNNMRVVALMANVPK